MTNTECYHLYFRNVIYNYIIDKKDTELEENTFIDYNEFNNSIISINDYITKINQKDCYARELEIFFSSKLFKMNIYVFDLTNNNKYKFLYKHIYNEKILTYTMILEHMLTVSKAEHFQLLYINNNYFNLEEINNNKLIDNTKDEMNINLIY